jgi:hypothetical protein
MFFSTTHAEKGGSTNRAFTLCGWRAVVGKNSLRVFYFPFGFAFNTIGFQDDPPLESNKLRLAGF